MQLHRSFAVVTLALGLTLLVSGTVAAQGRQGNDTGNCPPGQRTCTAPNQGHGRGMHGRGMQPGQGRGTGMGSQRGDWAANLPPAVEGEVPAAVVKAMQAGIADEYNAAATYEAVLAQFGNVRPFTNILRAEEQHAAAWAFLFDRYDLALPAAPADLEIPAFASLGEACTVAADAEVANMALYDQMLAAVEEYPDVTQVVTSLRNASAQKHLPAFERCAGIP